MDRQFESSRPLGLPLTAWQMSTVFVLVTLITASHLGEIAPTIARVLRILVYGATLLIIARLALSVLQCARRS
jgi:hypothetical protein